MFAVTFIAVLALQVVGYLVWRSYRNAAQRNMDARVTRVVNTAHATEYKGPTYSAWGNEQ